MATIEMKKLVTKISHISTGKTASQAKCLALFVMMLKIITFGLVCVLFFYPVTLNRNDLNMEQSNFTMRFTQVDTKSTYRCRYPEARAVAVTKEEIDYALNLPNGTVYNEALSELGICFAKVSKLNEDIGLCFCNRDKIRIDSRDDAAMFILFCWFCFDFFVWAHIIRSFPQVTFSTCTMLFYPIFFFAWGLATLYDSTRDELVPKMWLPFSMYETSYFLNYNRTSVIDGAWQSFVMFFILVCVVAFAAVLKIVQCNNDNRQKQNKVICTITKVENVPLIPPSTKCNI